MEENKSNNIFTQEELKIQREEFAKKMATPESIKNFTQDFAKSYLNSINNYLDYLVDYKYKENYKNPIYANNSLKQFNPISVRPKISDLVSWLNNPAYYEVQLKQISEFLSYTVTQYGRSLGYFSNILYLGYELIPYNISKFINSNYLEEDFLEEEKEEIITKFAKNTTKLKKELLNYEKKIYLQCKERATDWLKIFNIKDNFTNVEKEVIRSGGRCYNVRPFSKNTDYNNELCLQAMPEQYCYIDGRTAELGFTFSMNMAFFQQFPESMAGYAPEFARWYGEFIYELDNDKNANPWRTMPPESSVVFKFDDTRPEIIPPLCGTFKDALEIQDYKDLLKLRTELQTYQILFLKSPLNKDGIPTTSAQEIAQYMAVIQTMLPNGVVAVGAPFDMQETKFNNTQNMDNIIGIGDANYWDTSGITNALFGNTKSAKGIELGVEKDFLYVEPLYNQFERFINYHLSQLKGKYKFRIKFIRCPNFPYYIEKARKEAISLAQSGGSPTRIFATYGYEPYEIISLLEDAKITGIRDLMIPLQNSNQMSFDNTGGRPSNEDINEPDNGDSSDDTKTGGYNDE